MITVILLMVKKQKMVTDFIGYHFYRLYKQILKINFLTVVDASEEFLHCSGIDCARV